MLARSLMFTFACLSVLVTLASVPALTGGWVYDDLTLVGHPLLSRPSDIPGVFAHNSGDFLPAPPGGLVLPRSPTYRPLPMLSFALVSTIIGWRPAWHHAVSLSFHLLSVLLLCLFAARRGRLSLPASLLISAFALHPALAEAYEWINGRSDTLAGLFLCAAALVLRRAAERGAGAARQALWLFPVLIAGALSKETFLCAASALIVAALAESSSSGRTRALLPAALGSLAVATAVLLGARAATITWKGPALGGMSELRPLSLARVAPHLVALGLEELVSPQPRAMRLLAWDLSRPLGLQHILLLGAAVAALGLLLRRRSYRAIVLALGAAATLLPVCTIAGSFWLGLGRYLYQPACLLMMAALPAVPPVAPEDVSTASWRRPILLAVPLVLLLAVSHFASAWTYHSNTDFCLSLIRLRPEEPTGYVLLSQDALRRGDREGALMALERRSRGEEPPPLINAISVAYVRLGEFDQAAALIEQGVARYSGHKDLQLDLLTVRLRQRRWAEAAELARILSQDPVRGEMVRREMRRWLPPGQM